MDTCWGKSYFSSYSRHDTGFIAFRPCRPSFNPKPERMPSGGWPGNVVKILIVRVPVTLTVALSTLNLAPLQR